MATTTTTAAPTTTTTTTPPPTTFGLQILTPLSKVDRVSRAINPDTFRSIPGIWAVLNNDGTLSNVVEDTPSLVNKLVMNGRTGSIYESHDTSAGRIATMESIGIRCRVSDNLYSGDIFLGDRLVVSTAGATLGQLVSAETTTETGIYEIVARCEEINKTLGYMVFRTLSPRLITLV